MIRYKNFKMFKTCVKILEYLPLIKKKFTK